MMSYAAWEPVAARLRTSFRVLRCDFRGQLLSPGESHQDLDGHVDDVVSLLQDLDLQQVHVMGTSFGSEVALLLAARRPELVRSLAAVTSTDHGAPGIMHRIAALNTIVDDVLAGGERRKFHDRLTTEVYSSEFLAANHEALNARREQIDLLPEAWFEGLRGILSCLDGLDLRPLLDRIECRTLVVIAARDTLIPPAHSRALAAGISNSEIVEHPTSGHALVAEDPAWLVTKYLSFLGRLAR